MLCNLILQSKWREELKAKELALAQVEEQRRSKEAAESSNKRKLEALRLKIEIDFQRHKDDHQRLEQELSRLKLSAQSTKLNHQPDNLLTGKSEGAKPQGETIARLLHELDKLEDSSEKDVNCDRECIICSKDEVSIVFLPCAHQVLCANCNDSYGKKGKVTCHAAGCQLNREFMFLVLVHSCRLAVWFKKIQCSKSLLVYFVLHMPLTKHAAGALAW